MHLSQRYLVCCTLLAVIAVLLEAVAGEIRDASDATPVIRAPAGSFVGRNTNKTSHFLGIRYATAERFKAPVREFYDSNQVHEVQEYAPVCWQRVARDLPSAGRSEDCLFLNIWAPQSKIDEVASGVGNTTLLPVVFWIHGGGFVVGSGSNAVASGVSLTRENVILVSINYRLGLFGFWKHSELQNSGQQIVSNFGLHDQQMALEWVQENIAFFGGDPTQVTALGESAGGISILHHLTSARMNSDYQSGKPKLFHRAWVMSAVFLETPLLESPESEIIGAEWAAAKGCAGEDVVSCMRSKPAIDLVDPLTRWSAFDYDTNRATIYSVADADFPLLPVAIRRGDFDRDVPVVIGSSTEDGSLFSWFSFPVYGPEKPYLDYVIHRSFPHVADKVIARYPSEKYASEYWRFTEILSDAAWHCPAASVTQSFFKFSNAVARRYLFNYRFNDSADLFGIFHASELPLIFENPSGTYLFPRFFTERERALSHYFSNLIARYARDEISETEWPAFGDTTAPYLRFGDVNSTEISIQERFRSDLCTFWQASLPRGILDFPKGLYDQEGWRSNILNNVFWTFTNYEEHFTQTNGIIALLGSLL